MGYNPIMPSYPHIEKYHADLERFIEFGGSDNEQSIRRAFAECLDSYCREHREKLALVDELSASLSNRPDGTVKDSLRMARGYWEAKDSHDDLNAEIQSKLDRGYPKENIIFEDSLTAVLVQNGSEAMRVEMSRDGELHRLIRIFLDYELPEIQEFRQAQGQFKTDLPTVLENLRTTVAEAEADNPDYQQAAVSFLELCRKTIGPAVSPADVREMLLQHILTKDIFLSIFKEDQFHQENNVARQPDRLERTFFTGDVRRQAIDRLRAYYGVIGRAADAIADYAEKQQFLKAIYEDFYTAYNPAAADRLGVVYTPNEVVDFIIRGADHLLRKHFGKTLADDNVQILDPATGTGTFITNLPADRLEHKYLNEIHANEVAILPYYIANLNIEYTYQQRTGRYLEFPNLCFVDTLDNLDWQQQGATGGAVTRQGSFNLGGLSEENWIRIQEQNEKPISVIIGNPPYNDSAESWGDGSANRAYPGVEQRFRETYGKESTARKHHYDAFKLFMRWASDRLDDDGIIGFITNRSYVDAKNDDGLRKVMLREFSDVYILDLGGNHQSSGKTGNVFGIKVRVAIGFFVRNKASPGNGRVHYFAVLDDQSAQEKLSGLNSLNIEGISFGEITPDKNNNWLTKSSETFENLIVIRGDQEERLVSLFCPGVKTDRDDWVYDFDVQNLRAKALFFADNYNSFLERNDHSFDPIIKWSRDLRNEFRRGRRIVYNDANRIQSLYRPFTVKQYFADFVMNDVLTQNHIAMFGRSLTRENAVICVKGPSANHFAVLAANRLVNEKFAGTNDGSTFYMPLYRYTEDGERVSNITQSGIDRINGHYRQEWGKDFETLAGENGITAEEIFAYTYAVLHDPLYRQEYAVDLLREFPRLPLYPDFHRWAEMGQRLLDLHIGFESAEPYPLERHEREEVDPTRAILRADKAKGVITLDERTTLSGVPERAWEYHLGSRSALEWVLDQYKERKPRDPTIREKFNAYRFSDHKERVIDLLRRVCTVSVETMEIVDSMAYQEEEQPARDAPAQQSRT